MVLEEVMGVLNTKIDLVTVATGSEFFSDAIAT